MSETEYNSLLNNLSPRHKASQQVEIAIEYVSKLKGKHIEYKIHGKDSSGTFESHRRYKDFLSLRVMMVQNWPGCCIPKLPPKKMIGNLSEEFVEKRMRLLGNFLRKTVAIAHLFNSSVFQMFIKNQNPFEQLIKAVKPLTNLDLYLNFKENFPIEPSFEFGDDTSIYVSQVVHYLKNSLSLIKSLKKNAKKNIENFHTMKYNLCKLMAGIKELSPIFKKTQEVVFNVKRKRYQMYLILLDWASSEILDIEAMIEGIGKMHEIAEKFTIKNDNSLKNLLEENVENNQVKAQIVIMVQQRLVLFEIPRFREQKAAKWEAVLKSFIGTTKLEMTNLEEIVLEIDKNFNS